jgi:hypothetical protein
MELNEKLWKRTAKNYITECIKLKERGRDICAGILSNYDKFTFNNDEECVVTIELEELIECEIERIWVDRNTQKIMASLNPINISESNYIKEFDTCLDDEEYIDWSYIISCIIGID